MSTPSTPLASGFTTGWTKSDEPVPSRRRNAATQEAYDFFHGLALDTVVVIPNASAGVAKSAARQYMAERPQFKIGFQPCKDGLKAWKQNKPAEAPATTPAPEGAKTE